MNTSPLPLDSIAKIAAVSVRIARYSMTAVYAAQVYDWLISLADEYELIHQARWTSIKVAYLICRYYPLFVWPVYLWALLVDHSPELCARIVHPLYGFMPVFQLSAQAVILIRAYAFTGRNTLVLLVLGSCYLALMGTELWLFGTRFKTVEALYILLGNSGCFGNDAGAEAGQPFQYINATQTGVVMLCTFFLDFLMTITVIVHCFRIRSTQGPLGKAFLAQGFTAFLVMSALNLLTSVLYLGASREYNGIGLPFLLLSDILACRLILTLRRRVSPTESFELREQSRIVREALNPDLGVTRKSPIDHWVC